MSALHLGDQAPQVCDALRAFGYDVQGDVVTPEALASVETHVAANYCLADDWDASRVYDLATIPDWLQSELLEGSAALTNLITAEPEPEPTGLAHVGAWMGSVTLGDALKRRVDLATAVGLDRVTLVLNDNTGRYVTRHGKRVWKQRTHFHLLARPADVERAAAAFQAAGIDVALMTWLMPQRAFVDQAAEVLLPLCDATGARLLQLDLEEPWTTDRFEPHADVAAHFMDRFAGRCKLGVTAIVYHHVRKLAPFVEACDELTLQAYATSRQKAAHLHPGAIVRTAEALTRKRYPALAADLVMGLAAYYKAGAGGLTARAAMDADFDAVDRLPTVNAAELWWSESLAQSAPVRASVSHWTSRRDAAQAAQRLT